MATETRRTSSRVAGKPTAATSASAPTSSTKRKAEDTPTTAKTTKAKVEKKAAENEQESAKSVSTTSKTLEKGSVLPSITLKDESGKDVSISQLKKTVLFTYPKANTPGCTTQACLFRDDYTKFQKAGFQVYGLSSDSENSLKNWKEKKGFGYSLLSDPKRQLIGPLTGSKSATIRSHFVIDAQGKLALSAVKVKPVDSSPSALKFAQSL